MKNSKIKDMTILAMLIAITVVMGLIPQLGIIQIGVVSLTTLHIPVIIAAFTNGIIGSTICGATFGVVSWIVAATRGVSPVDLLFVNPLVSVLPRVLFGLCVGLLKTTITKGDRKALKSAVIAFFSTVIHTFLVFTALYLVNKEVALTISDLTSTVGNFIPYIVGAFSINALLEAALAAGIMYLLAKALGRYLQ